MTDSLHNNYRCIKLPLKNILDNEKHLKSINDAIYKANIVTSKAYMLLRYWILDKYYSNELQNNIDKNLIKIAFKSIIKYVKGRSLSFNNELLKKNFDKISTQIFSIKPPINNNGNNINNLDMLNEANLEDGLKLSTILDYYSITMVTAIENNIKIHFFDHFNRFINNYFIYINKENIDKKITDKNKLRKELKKVKFDLLNKAEILTSDIEYHDWINKNRINILPNIESINSKNYYYDIKENPQRYLKYMIFMNIELEKIGQKMFQFFPLQTDNIPKHIQIDTKGLIEIFETNASKLFKNIESNKTKMWTTYFPLILKSPKYKMKKYTFDNCIITDGYSVSIRYIKNTHIEINNQKKQKMKQGKTDKTDKTDKKVKSIQKQKTLGEFPYIDDISRDDLTKYKKHIFIDPGKRSLFTMMDDEDTFFSYTNKCRISETMRLKYQRILKNHRDKSGITQIEKDSKLSEYNSKTCNLEKFKQYIKIKLEINDKFNTNNIKYEDLYKDIKFRKYKLYGYINRKRAEDNMINKIDEKFKINKRITNKKDLHKKKSKESVNFKKKIEKYNKYVKREDCVIIIGDWSSGKQMANFISTPNIGLKRKLKENYKVYNIDEFRTSCLHNKTEEYCNNLYLKKSKETKYQKMHPILTYKMENNRKGCINRDKNSCKNIKKLYENYIKDGTRLEKYRRDYKIE